MRVWKKVISGKTLYGAALLLVLWYLVHRLIKSSIVPNPIDSFILFFKLLRNGLLVHIGVSLLRILVSTIIAMLIGVPLGLWTGVSKKADTLISPLVYILYPIPKIAFLPVFMLLFGLGDTSKIILIISIIMFQILLAARDGVREIPIELFYSVKSLNLSTAAKYIHVVVPAVLPKIISALRISVGISISVLFFSENFATTYGIGYYIMYMWAILKYKEMFAGIIGLCLMSLIIFKSIDLLEQRLCSWMFAANNKD